MRCSRDKNLIRKTDLFNNRKVKTTYIDKRNYYTEFMIISSRFPVLVAGFDELREALAEKSGQTDFQITKFLNLISRMKRQRMKYVGFIC